MTSVDQITETRSHHHFVGFEDLEETISSLDFIFDTLWIIMSLK